jgi:16S rRNA (cytosine1402-N4)-methyltransferase
MLFSYRPYKEIQLIYKHLPLYCMLTNKLPFKNDAIHTPVLLKEAVDNLLTNLSGTYIDCTFGRGGHSQAILNKLHHDAKLLVVDQDHNAVEVAHKLAMLDKRVIVKHGSFTELDDIISNTDIKQGDIDGILLDLGVCSSHLDEAERGFSFLRDGPLDMRMNQQQKLTASNIIATYSGKQLANIFKKYGEERFANRIANYIVEKRKLVPINSTAQLAQIVAAAHPRWQKHKHPATRVFQALRIEVNHELEALTTVLPTSLSLLKVGGRLAVISFHSLEDRIVKRFIAKNASGDIPHNVPVRDDEIKRFCRKIIATSATSEEVERNLRSRSAMLRVAEKLIENNN